MTATKLTVGQANQYTTLELATLVMNGAVEADFMAQRFAEYIAGDTGLNWKGQSNEYPAIQDDGSATV